MKNMEPYLSQKEVRELFGVSAKTIYRWIKGRAMPYKLIGGQLRFLASELSDWIDKAHEAKINEKREKLKRRRKA